MDDQDEFELWLGRIRDGGPKLGAPLTLVSRSEGLPPADLNFIALAKTFSASNTARRS